MISTFLASMNDANYLHTDISSYHLQTFSKERCPSWGGENIKQAKDILSIQERFKEWKRLTCQKNTRNMLDKSLQKLEYPENDRLGMVYTQGLSKKLLRPRFQGQLSKQQEAV